MMQRLMVTPGQKPLDAQVVAAAAHAEQGGFAAALRWIDVAIDRAGKEAGPEVVALFRERRALYSGGKCWYEAR